MAAAAGEHELLLEMTRWPSPDGTGPWLERIIAKLAEEISAERGYVELYRKDGQTLTVSFRCTSEQEEEIRSVTSSGIVASAIASGKTVHTPYALLDERFGKQPSVQNQRLEAVICAPLSGLQAGVLYLEGRRGKGAFKAEHVALTEHVARFLGPVLETRAPHEVQAQADPTRPFREKLRLDALAGRSAALAKIFEQLQLVAPLDITVLLTGESGTGKTQLARAIHDNSPRRDGPFVELSCAAIPESLFEAELFGTRLGAFTGARQLDGKVDSAEGGTLFLDEVGEIPLAAQAKLLQLLQSKQFYALGSTDLLTANIRVIAASNSQLETLVAEKRFREDLFYRLNTFSVRVPSLSERREDIGPILELLVKRVAFEHSMPALPLSTSMRLACETTEWPGNVRQLRNKLEQALIRAVAESSAQIEARHLEGRPASASDGAANTFAEATRFFQRELLRRELDASEWNVREVARRLDLTRSHVYNLIRTFGFQREPK
ncbi:MAG: sigma-54-dependent Fis family transcriptional regulator [Archangium sp.]|nr:sigma-54-dependent Fis family transcriptional regulator [Archangium sp.]